MNTVCIDDFALKKRHRYGTIMINAHTRQVVDLLPSREQKAVSDWLKKFPSLKIVIRDGATFFRNAIKEAHPKAVQIADRFHVYQSLTRHAEKAIRTLLPKKLPLKKSAVKTTSQEQKKKVITSVRELRATGLSLSAIGRQLQLDARTVKRYLDPSTDCMADHQYREYKRELDDYAEQLSELFLRYQKLEDIYNELVIQGYSCSFFTFQKTYKSVLANLKEEESTTYVYRRPIIKLLFHEFDYQKLSPQIIEIFQKIPEIFEIVQAVHQFKTILGTANFSALDIWLLRVKIINNKHLNSFVRGFLRDQEAIRNSMIFPELSNGLAEGKINKLKLIKRVMFGRGHFETLKKKVLLMG